MANPALRYPPQRYGRRPSAGLGIPVGSPRSGMGVARPVAVGVGELLTGARKETIMSRKKVQFAIATEAIAAMLAAVPNGCWFLFQNVRFQGLLANKPADSRMSDKKELGYRFVGQADENGQMTDLAATLESPSITWREDEEGNRIQGTNYPSVMFRGDLAKAAVKHAKAWDTVSIFGKVETARKVDKDGKVSVSVVHTALLLLDGTQEVSAQLASDESVDLSIQA